MQSKTRTGRSARRSGADPSPGRRRCVVAFAGAPVVAAGFAPGASRVAALTAGLASLLDPRSVRAAARDVPLPAAAWPALLARSARERRPIVAMFSLPGCPYCIAMRREHLAQLAREQESAGVLVAEFQLSDSTTIPGTDGPSASALARRFGVRQAPTVCFLGPDGTEIAERLTGYSPDFFGAYLQDRIAQSRRALGNG